MKRTAAIAAFVVLSAAVAGFAAHKTARLSDPLERAVLGLLVGGVPLAVSASVVDRRTARRRLKQPARWILALQAAFAFQLCSVMLTALIAAVSLALAWPIRTVNVTLVVLAGVIALSATANIAGIRAWTRIRVRVGRP